MKYLKIFTDFAKDIEKLNDAEVGRLFRAMLLYAETETETTLKGNERFLWGTAKKSIDNQSASYKKQCETNKRIAVSRFVTNRNEPSRIVTNRNEALQDKEKDKEKDKDYKKEKKAKRKYGLYGNVLLADEEYSKLPEAERDRAITFLDEYIEEKGYKSKSHYLAIRRWVLDAIKTKGQNGVDLILNSIKEDMNDGDRGKAIAYANFTALDELPSADYGG